MNCHVIYTENGRIRSCEIVAHGYVEAEAAFIKGHPNATYWEIGLPLVEVSALQHGAEHSK